MAIDKVKLPDNSVEEVRDSRIPGIDSTPTANSANLVTSGGVKSALDGYLSLSGGTMTNTNLVTNLNADLLDGKHNGDLYSNGLRDYNNGNNPVRRTAGNIEYTDGGLHYHLATSSMTDSGRPGGDGQIIALGWDTRTHWNSQLYIASSEEDAIQAGSHMKLRHQNGSASSWEDWHSVAMTDSNVASATKLETSRTIWGQSFDGTGDVSGYMSGMTGLLVGESTTPTLGTMTGATALGIKSAGERYGLFEWVEGNGNVGLQVGRSDGQTTAYHLMLNPLGGNVGIGTATPAYKLDVAGDIRAEKLIGTATGITETSLEDEEFTYQATPVHDIADAYRIDRIKGRTLAFNQLVQNGNFAEASGWASSNFTVAISGGILTATSTSSSDNSSAIDGNVLGTIQGHKYYIRASVRYNTSLPSTTPWIGSGGYDGVTAPLSSLSLGTWGEIKGIFTRGTGGDDIIRFYPRPAGWEVGDTVSIKDVMLIDLTLMFGAGNEPETVEEFEAMFPLPYYAYNEGELISVAAEGIETVGFNLFDEGIMSGWNYITRNADGWSGALNRFYLHRCFENTFSYTGRVFINMNYSLDEGTGFLTAYYVDGTYNDYRLDPATRATVGYETPAGKVIDHIEFSYTKNGTLTIHSLCVNLSDASRNGTYEPHWSKVLPLGLDAFKVKSHNIWDEEWQNGYWNTENGEFISLADCICNKNPIRVFPFTSYYIGGQGAFAVLFYDKSGNYIGYETPRATFTAPQNAYYLNWHTFAFTTYNHNICINVSDPAFNGQYEPHGVITVNGLASAGDVHDEIRGGKYIKRVGRVDLGTLTWTKGNAQTYDSNLSNFYTTNFAVNVESGGDLICGKYANDTSGEPAWEARSPYSISMDGNLYLVVVDSGTYTGETLKTALSGVYLYYELETPVIYDLVSPVPLSGRIDGNGTMRVISDNIVAPFNGDITYGCNPGQIAADSNALMGYVNSVFDLRYYETSEPSGGMLPNREYQLGTLSGNTTFTLAAGTSGVTNHYFWSFDTGSTAPTITWPSGITSWYGGSAPTINASKHYEVSVLNGVAVVMEV